jgi:exodeoxyribonuclease VII small subunit
MKNFEERLERLEELGEQIRNPALSLDDAIKAFEEGIRLAKSLEKDLEKAESRVEILLNGPAASPATEDAGLGLFDTGD